MGMSCAVCSSHVQKAVESVEGVKNVNVNLLTNSMSVDGDFSGDQNLSEKIILAVQKAGYDAKIVLSTVDSNLSKNVIEENCNFSDKNKFKNKKLDSQTKSLLNRFVISLLLLIPLMYISMGHMMWNFPLPKFFDMFEKLGISKVFMVGVFQAFIALIILFINRIFFTNGIKAIFRRAANMDTLIALGAGVSYLYSFYNLFPIVLNQIFSKGKFLYNLTNENFMMPDLYFESAAMIVTLITLGKALESFSKGKTTNALKSLQKLAPKTATILKDSKEILVNIEQVKVGDIVVVKTGESIPVDGVIIQGSASINESNLTGESIPVDKNISSEVFASTLCMSGNILIKTTKVQDETAFGKIIQLVIESSSSKAPIAKTADVVSSFFVPTVIGIGFLTFVIWLILGKDFSSAINFGICVLVISCPCSLGLATPVSIMVGNGVAAKNGILFKTATSLESTGKINVCVMDKTGTVTNGTPVVTDVISKIDEEEFLSIAYSIEKKSSHPLAKSVCDFCKEKSVQEKKCEKFIEVVGNGLEAIIEGKKIKAGNVDFVLGKNLDTSFEKFLLDGKTPLLFSSDNILIGIIFVLDVEKKSSKAAIKELKKLGIETVLLTGDNEKTAKAIATRVGIGKVFSNVKPDGKEKIIADLSKDNKVCMVGDGVNDAPSLKRAFVGIAIGAGTDVALDAADVVLMKSDLIDVVNAIKISRKTLKNIHQNLFWAFFYNSICIPIAAGVFSSFGIVLKPMFGAFAMSLSSFCVVLNSLRLNFIKLNNSQIEVEDFLQEKNKLLNSVQTEKKYTGGKKMKKTMIIKGMMCEHCQKHVTDALNSISGVNAIVNHKDGTAIVESESDVSDDVLTKVVVDAGYEVVEIS